MIIEAVSVCHAHSITSVWRTCIQLQHANHTHQAISAWVPFVAVEQGWECNYHTRVLFVLCATALLQALAWTPASCCQPWCGLVSQAQSPPSVSKCSSMSPLLWSN